MAKKTTKADTVKIVVRSLGVELNETQIGEKLTAVAGLELDIVELEAKRKAINTRIRGMKGAILEHCKNHRDGHEERDVEVEIRHNYRLGVVTATRKDTGVVLDKRAMTVEERQADLALGDEKAKPPAKPTLVE